VSFYFRPSVKRALHSALVAPLDRSPIAPADSRDVR
jgi:hypothetical protein